MKPLRLRAYWPVALVVIVAAVLRSFIWLNSDVSWLLTQIGRAHV